MKLDFNRRIAVFFGTLALWCQLTGWDVKPHPGMPPEQALLQVGLMILGIGLSYLAGRLLAKKVKQPFDDRVTTLAARGSFLARVIGRRRIGPIFAWAGNRTTRKEKQDGGKGSLFAGPKVTVYVENGWHLLCMGPAKKLHAIYQNGTAIFKGPITSTSHPSGTTIDLGKEGSFRIFWGEFDQPVNSFLGDATRVTISSGWPGDCYIEWRSKRLGTSAIWPTLEYEIEVRNQTTILTGTPAYMEPTRTLDGNIASMLSVTPGAAGTGKFVFGGDISGLFFPAQLIHLTGHTGMSNGDLTIRKIDVRIVETVIGTDINGIDIISTEVFTDIFVESTITGATADGQIQGYTEAADDGMNYAHVIAELLFLDDSYGMAQDQDLYDMQSLEDLGTRCVTENLKCSIAAPDGAQYLEVIAGMLTDLGVFLSQDYTTGLLTFVPIREPTGDLPLISDALQTRIPEILVKHADLVTTNVLYAFKDREHNFQDSTIGADNDGQVRQMNLAKAETNQIISTVNFDTASVITERRQQEALASGAAITLHSNRATRALVPGQALTSYGFDETQRLIAVETDPLSGEVALNLMTDYYGAPLSTFQQNGGLTQVAAPATSPDLQVGIVEIPEYLLQGTQEQSILVPRIRYDSTVQGADLNLSRDDTTYTFVARDLTLITGGVLLDALTPYDFEAPSTSPTFTTKGPDIGEVLDLSADLTSWANGRQLAVLIDPTTLAYEICFLKKVTAVGGGVYSMNGLLRARYDTPQQSFGIGALVFIFQDDDGVPINDVLLEPQVDVFVKSQPFGPGGQVPLTDVAPVQIALYGKGVRPLPVQNIRADVGLSTYLAGADMVVRWDYFTPRTTGSGAGFQGAGAAVSSVSPEGDFIVEILNSVDTVIRTFSQSASSYTYTFAQRNTDFAGDPATLKFRITQLRGGFSSDTTTKTFTKVS